MKPEEGFLLSFEQTQDQSQCPTPALSGILPQSEIVVMAERLELVGPNLLSFLDYYGVCYFYLNSFNPFASNFLSQVGSPINIDSIIIRVMLQ